MKRKPDIGYSYYGCQNGEKFTIYKRNKKKDKFSGTIITPKEYEILYNSGERKSKKTKYYECHSIKGNAKRLIGRSLLEL